ncbi:WXG100 family type VII secretion target [Ornithinimicrobium panacihumi]|uniref:WXG100 family type VII secretion target n=1 Tax=Ornithinimicrobium panacihumi TaxID=2008449 RepID=UPI003F8C6871
MSNTFAVDTARIAAASGDIERIASTIESEVRAMMAKLTGLQDCWQGSASGNFQAVSQDWSATQERVRASLQQISMTLRSAGQDYELVEQANRMRFTPA